MRILVKYPTRARPTQFLTALSKAIQNQKTEDVRYMINIDADDETMTMDVIEAAWAQYSDIRFYRNYSSNKIHAVNRDLELDQHPWDVIVLLSDDMLCQKNGWDEIIIEKMKKAFPDTDGCLWFNDGYTQDRLCTMVIMGRKYFDRFGYLYHPDYVSLWCDNEQMDVARSLDRIRYYDEILFKHEHPANNGEQQDELYRANEKFYSQDHDTYMRRKAAGFPQ